MTTREPQDARDRWRRFIDGVSRARRYNTPPQPSVTRYTNACRKCMFGHHEECLISIQQRSPRPSTRVVWCECRENGHEE